MFRFKKEIPEIKGKKGTTEIPSEVYNLHCSESGRYRVIEGLYSVV